MSSRFASAFLIAFASIVLIGPAQAQTADEILLKSARAIARISLVEPVCGQFYLIDRKRLAEVKGWLVQDGIDRFGAQTSQRWVDRVRPEFLAAIKRDGAAQWCPEQRDFYKQPGQPEFIGSLLE